LSSGREALYYPDLSKHNKNIFLSLSIILVSVRELECESNKPDISRDKSS